jgi:hypothetical protein
MFATGNLMESMHMKIRHLLVAASAAAILAGSSFGALAGSWNFSKGESRSSVVSVGTVIYHTPFAITLQKQSNNSVTVGTGGYNVGAGASAGTFGGAEASKGGGGIFGYSGPSASAFGGTHGSSCAGSAC